MPRKRGDQPVTGPRLEQYVDKLGEHRWRALGGSRIVGDSSEGYIDDADMQIGALDTLDAILRSGIPGVHTRVATWLAAGHDGPEES